MRAKTCLLIALTVALSFITFSFVVGNGVLKTLDLTTTTTLQKFIPRIFDFPFSILSILGSFEITTVALLSFALYLYKKNRTLIAWTFFLYFFGNISELLGKLLLFHPSPPSTYYRYVGIIFPSSYIHTDYAYPSGHMYRITFIASFILLGLNLKNKLLISTVLVIFVILMVVSRVYLGEHWLTDVIGGSLLGVSLGSLTYLFSTRKKSNQ